jgi:ferric-dicitrate binding protein FerR (iron transport regulator)
MNNPEKLDDLITRHFCDGLSGGEQAALSQWLSASEENRQYYEALKNTWQLMKAKQTHDEINVNQEWNYFQECLVQDTQGQRNYTDYAGAVAGGSNIVRRILVATAIAASVLLIIAVGYNWSGNKQSASLPATAAVEKNKPTIILARHEINATNKVKRLVLPDNSEILLEPSSEVTWNEPFTSDRRDILLKGKARFQVAKDKARPFTVISGGIATTALGTQFTVTAFEQSPFITVQLYEGRVVVKSWDSTQPALKKELYLLPGEELLYSNNQHTAQVRRFAGENIANRKQAPDENIIADQPSMPAGEKESWYMFNNQPLAQVFRQLEEMYGVDIVFPEKEVAKMYFIGKFSKKDSVNTILKQIASLNNLTISRQSNKYIINRQ